MLVLVAFAMAVILVVVAIVIDFGVVRATRQDSKRSADVAATAGLQDLASDGVPRPWRGVCAALAFLRANQPDLTFTVTYSNGAGGPAPQADPCATGSASRLQLCTPNAPTTWAWIRATAANFVADIKSGYITPDAAFPEDAAAYSADNGAVIRGGCDQLAVIIADRDTASFGRVVGATDYDTLIRSVGRVALRDRPEGSPAFLMVERTRCDVLSESVGTGGGQGIIVEPATGIDPGIIHVDSKGLSSAGCTGSNTTGGRTVFSGGINGTPGIIARPAGSLPGLIEIEALEAGPNINAWGSATGCAPNCVSPLPTAGFVVSRQPVDTKYNPSTSPTITNIHRDGYLDAVRSSAPAVGRGALNQAVSGIWRTLGCGDTTGMFTETKIFVNCTSGYQPVNVTFTSATDVIFNGPVQVTGAGPGSRALFMPAAERVVVGGNSTRGLEVNNGARLGINSNPFPSDDPGVTGACTGREIPFPGTHTATLVVFGGGPSGAGQGGLNVAGRAALCQTFVYLAGPKSSSNATYSRQAVTNETYDESCTPETPCPADSTTSPVNVITNAQVIVEGYVRWSAPNQISPGAPTPGGVGVEDLALWTETYATTEVKAGGTLDAFGVFFLPNARTEMRSPASATPRDAQFIGRSLRLMQGTLQMQPTPGNAVRIPLLAGISLVR